MMNTTNNLVFWAHSYCRSTLQFYSELSKAVNRNCVIYTWIDSLDLRTATGFSNSEFASLHVEHVGNDIGLASEILQRHIDDYNIFCAYQSCPVHQHLINLLIDSSRHYGIISEAPCNMEPHPQRLLKSLYQRYYLPHKLQRSIQHADFILNCSGYYEEGLLTLGWKPNQIISCGYYPPPLPQSQCVKRTADNWRNFTILLSGLHQWHRSPMVLLKALSILRQKNLFFRCYITQDGPLLNQMKDYVKRHSLTDSVTFLGFVPLEKLINLYQSCSVYVGAGSYEPWGMRLNDALQCGAPLVVNRGMGGVKMIDDYGCGLSFDRGNYKMLADQLELLITDKSRYLECAEKAYAAYPLVSPKNKASEMISSIRQLNANIGML